MINLKPYGEYKSTGFQWLNNVPEHWDIRPNKYLWSERKQVNFTDEQLLSVTINDGVILQSELLKATSKRDSSNLDKSKYKLVKPNDITYNKMRMWQGAVGVSNHKGIVSPAYIVLKPRWELNSKYYHYLLRTPNYIEESYRYSYGICDDQLSLRFEEFKSMNNIVPPKEEQDQIVRFLDSKLLMINKFIKNKKKLIELLKEKKQAVINQAVTKGLDPDAKMKPSGIEWLGDVPEGWEVRPLKSVLRNIIFTTKQNLPGRFYIGLENVESWSGKIHSLSSETIFDSQAKLFEAGDILLGKLRPYLAKVTKIDFSGYCSGEFLVLRPNKKVVHDNYMECLIRSNTIIDIINRSTFGAKMPRAEWNFIGTIKVGIPNKEEQYEISSYLETQTQAINKAINRITKEIELITEYRTSLISAVVTGQVDVRDVHVEEPKEILEEELEAIEEELPLEQKIPESEAI